MGKGNYIKLYLTDYHYQYIRTIRKVFFFGHF